MSVFVLSVPDLPNSSEKGSSDEESDKKHEEIQEKKDNRDAEFKKKQKQFDLVSKSLPGTVVEVIYFHNSTFTFANFHIQAAEMATEKIFK